MPDSVSDDTMMIDTLEGFLAALAIGPTTVLPSEWLPAVQDYPPIVRVLPLRAAAPCIDHVVGFAKK